MNTLTIEEKYLSLGGSNSFLGSPQKSKDSCPDQNGIYRNFANGVIIWHPEFGAHEVHGGIFKEWKHNDYERGFLGYPISDEMDWTTDDLRKILPPEDVYLTWGHKGFPIGEWLKTNILNRETQSLGRYSQFQGGCITWWDGFLPSNKEKHEWVWRRDQSFYIPTAASTTEHKYLSTGGANGLLGAPQGDEHTCSDIF